MNNHDLYLKQKRLLDTFLEHGAIDQKQYDKSLGDLKAKMKIEEPEDERRFSQKGPEQKEGISAVSNANDNGKNETRHTIPSTV